MKYASTIENIPNAFSLRPLEGEQLRMFYCEDTIFARNGDQYMSPIEEIVDRCLTPSEQPDAFLLLGQRGSGKSTELNYASERLRAQGYQVATIQCAVDLNLMDADCPDLLILMGDALIQIAKNLQCHIKAGEIERIQRFWTATEEEIEERVTEIGASVKAEASIGTPEIFKPVLDLFFRMKQNLKFNATSHKTCRNKIVNHTGIWVDMINQLAASIQTESNGKPPILIFEDLDKMDPQKAWEMFFPYSTTLASFPFPIIYTFPISVSYFPKYGMLEDCFNAKLFPMIRLQVENGVIYQPGYDAIMKIVLKRADKHLFQDNALDLLIRKTGGSLRHLFKTINESSQRAMRRRNSVIDMEDAMAALLQIKSNLTRRIEKRHYTFLSDICAGGHTDIQDRDMMLELIQAGVVLEYVGGWHYVHPLVADYLKEKGLISHA